MRLIDADVLLDKTVRRNSAWNSITNSEGKNLEEILSELPSVNPQEPKTGRWIEHFDESGKWYECDQCHTDWGGSVNYCPNCGAKM